MDSGERTTGEVFGFTFCSGLDVLVYLYTFFKIDQSIPSVVLST